VNAVVAVENHSGRPEVQTALTSGNGVSVRFSKTLGVSEIYVAVPFQQNGNVLGVVRVAKPLSLILVAVDRVRKILLIGALIALVITNFITFMAASLIGAMIKALTASVRRMISGDLNARTGAQTSDEVGELGRAIDEFAAGVSTKMSQGQGFQPPPYDPRFLPR
jgi:two-component system phosphate regulon sensor histidine kinase PhoR